MVLELLRWWYGPGWLAAVNKMGTRAAGVGKSFSVGRLFGTLFEPWRRIVTVSDRTISSKLHAAGDNFISRMVGFVVRLLVLLTAGILLLLVGVGSMLEIVLWPLLPPAMLYCLARSVTG